MRKENENVTSENGIVNKLSDKLRVFAGKTIEVVGVVTATGGGVFLIATLPDSSINTAVSGFLIPVGLGVFALGKVIEG